MPEHPGVLLDSSELKVIVVHCYCLSTTSKWKKLGGQTAFTLSFATVARSVAGFVLESEGDDFVPFAGMARPTCASDTDPLHRARITTVVVANLMRPVHKRGAEAFCRHFAHKFQLDAACASFCTTAKDNPGAGQQLPVLVH